MRKFSLLGSALMMTAIVGCAQSGPGSSSGAVDKTVYRIKFEEISFWNGAADLSESYCAVTNNEFSNCFSSLFFFASSFKDNKRIEYGDKSFLLLSGQIPGAFGTYALSSAKLGQALTIPSTATFAVDIKQAGTVIYDGDDVEGIRAAIRDADGGAGADSLVFVKRERVNVDCFVTPFTRDCTILP